MTRRQQAKRDGRAGELAALGLVLISTGDQAKLEPLDPALDCKEAARYLGLALQTVRNMTARGELPRIKYGRHCVRYPFLALKAWRDERTRPASS